MTIALLAAAFEWATPPAAARPVLAFGSFSINSDVNDQVFPGVAGGVLLDFASLWASAGVQGDVFFSGGYASGRGGPFGRVNLVRRRLVRVFAVGGYAWGEMGGPTLGGGIELWPKGRIGVRASLQDYLVRVQGFDCAFFGMDQPMCNAQFHGGRAFTGHQPSVNVGIIWR
jgi:hypothetical protein